MDLNSFIKNKAREVGIELCGITDYSLSQERIDYLRARKLKGQETEFEEQDLELRIDPRLTMESVESIIVLGLSYNTGGDYGSDYEFKGRLSRSSYGQDYHRVLREKMEELVGLLKKELDFDHKIFVDTGPLIDRELAYLAGLGYYGKNCSIINDDYGSYIFIGYIMTDMKIENDRPLNKDCGSCDLCLRACPTGAIKDYRMNPKRCLSYMSQTKELLSDEMIVKLGDRIYGCDSCQEACPKNKGVLKSSHREFIPDPSADIDIVELFKMSNKDFKKNYGHMAGSWRGKNLLKRNGIINIYNSRLEEGIDYIREELDNPSQLVSYYANWVIDKYNRGEY